MYVSSYLFRSKGEGTSQMVSRFKYFDLVSCYVWEEEGEEERDIWTNREKTLNKGTVRLEDAGKDQLHVTLEEKKGRKRETYRQTGKELETKEP